jgi:segregation and condensation protein B
MDLKGIIEAILFIAEEPLNIQEMAVITDTGLPEVEKALQEVIGQYEGKAGLQVIKVAGGYQIATRPEVALYIEKMEKEGHTLRLSQAAMESLAIIAYKQPVTRVEIEAIRGVRVDRVLENLLKKKLIRITGRKQIPGRPMTYGTTKKFLQYFGLNDLTDLPPLGDFKELQKSL